MKDHKTVDKKSKRKSLVLTENTDVDEEWKPLNTSPLKPIVNVSNRTSFHFVLNICVA